MKQLDESFKWEGRYLLPSVYYRIFGRDVGSDESVEEVTEEGEEQIESEGSVEDFIRTDEATEFTAF